jgi:hypothetical protein
MMELKQSRPTAAPSNFASDRRRGTANSSRRDAFRTLNRSHPGKHTLSCNP